MELSWINPKEYSFNSLLLLETFQIEWMFDEDSWLFNEPDWQEMMGIALNGNPHVKWYLMMRAPSRREQIETICQNAPNITDTQSIRKAEVYILTSIDDFITYTTPEIMDKVCDFIIGWDEQHLFDLVDLTNKRVLDVGAGNGRLTFSAAKVAKEVFASEPVDTLREFMRQKIKNENINNVKVVDGLITDLPYPDNTFDVVMSGHVMGDNLMAEIDELTRVCKNNGILINCPGDSKIDMVSSNELKENGWEEFHYVGSFGKDVYIHRKHINK